MSSTAEYIREHRKTPRGAMAVKVRSRAEVNALKWVRANHPAEWSDFLDQAWIELTGQRPGRGRPRAPSRPQLPVASAPLAAADAAASSVTAPAELVAGGAG